MQALKDKIKKEGKYLGKGILKVDSFMNHQIDPKLMKEIGEEFARHFSGLGTTRILTAETSGIAPALSAALALEVPLVFARKNQPVTMAENPYKESAPSHTHGKVVELIVSPEYLSKDDSVLIIDDFLASARTIKALVKLVKTSGANLVGIGAVIEKSFEGGRQALAELAQDLNLPLTRIHSLAVIEKFEDNQIVFKEN
ncbi:MAG: xanthine phosphoribosyltransferase [Candidatus Obscuribacterales bacterium]|nr:xanthine phosphoribosyltransferase [Candidatus Obscuribacterales bacterium]